ncbi:MAG TPA: alpha-amylase family glycosyl hydrolase, partial [Bacillota bacterium]|nr:alpha-amylase family glycosyl hydrolase [Bacillota bacterium]
MTKKILFVFFALLISVSIVACSNTTTGNTTLNPTTSENTTIEENIELIQQDPTVESGYLADNVQDGTILHAWNWSMSTIESQLEEIAIAGFSTIQISPMQPQKDFFGIGVWSSQWWKLYQPLGFSIATENHSLGTKADLISLTEAADEYGIKIIVDVVANHLAGGDNDTLNPDVRDYEVDIYDMGLIRTGNGYASDSSIASVTRGALGGFPDLQTESEIVQQRVLDLLKEYVDAGVDGFRFDAAKHIETPEDGAWASDFWPTVINGVKDYAESLGRDDLYFYGEILNTAGFDRSFSDYTSYMSVTASNQGDVVRQAVISKNGESIVNAAYLSGVPASKTVLWAESHDTYANESGLTKNTPDSFITKTYAIQASRKDATTLYFARPNDNTFMGMIGSYLWQSIEVASVNRFHNYFIGTDEYQTSQNGFYLNERFDDEIQGVIIVDLNGTQNVNNLNVINLPDGNYLDQISKNIFTVSDGKISGQMSQSGVAVIYNNPYEPKPALFVSNDGLRGSFSDTLNISVFSYNATESYYSLNGGEKIAFSGNTVIELSHPDDNATVTLDFEIY